MDDQNTTYLDLWDEACREYMPDYPGWRNDSHDWDQFAGDSLADGEYLSQVIKRRQNELADERGVF